MPSIDHALLLCAGLGTRLRPLTSVRCKPAIPLAGEPMARRILRWLGAAGVTDVVINLHHLPHTLTGVVGDGSDLGLSVKYSWEQPHVLGSAGGPRRALDIVGAPIFFIVNGDTLTDMLLHDLEAAHRRGGALVTLALVPNLEPARYGGVLLSDDGVVTGFVGRGSSARSFHFIGVQVAHRDAFRNVPADRPVNSIGEAYDALIAAQPGSIRGHVCTAGFWDIGTVDDYWRTSRAFARTPGPSSTTPGSLVDTILWDDVQVSEGVRLERCIVTDGVRLEAGATYSNAILMRGADGTTVTVPFEERA